VILLEKSVDLTIEQAAKHIQGRSMVGLWAQFQVHMADLALEIGQVTVLDISVPSAVRTPAVPVQLALRDRQTYHPKKQRANASTSV
jgi:hypothetical protein